jgi:hypothetical protein
MKRSRNCWDETSGEEDVCAGAGTDDRGEKPKSRPGTLKNRLGGGGCGVRWGSWRRNAETGEDDSDEGEDEEE